MAEIIVSTIVSSEVLENEGDKLHVRYGGQVLDTEVYSGAEIHVSEGGTADSTYIYSSGFMYVSEGGIANSTHLRPSGWMEVYSGGTANATIVDSRSNLTVHSGGKVTITYNPWQGSITSSKGAEITYLDRDAGIYYGGNDAGLLSSANTISNLEIDRNQSAIVFGENYTYIYGAPVKTADAGLLVSAKVNSRAYLYISNGGLASGTLVKSGGNMYVSSGGSANTGDISGNIIISRGGEIEGIRLYGSMNIQDGGSATNTTVYAGAYINGIAITKTETYATGITISGGRISGNTAYLYNDQSAKGATISTTGTLQVSSGGTLISGYIYDNKLTGGGSAVVIVSNGGLAEATRIQGARLGIGQTWASTILPLSESYTYSHHITRTWNNIDAYLIVKSGGSATNTQVNYNGTLTVLSSGYADGVSVQGATWEYWNWNQSHTVMTLFSSGADSAFVHADGGTVYGADINALGYMYVYNGGLAESAFVNLGGNMEVTNNGSSLHTSIFAGGNMVVGNGGYADETLVNSRGRMSVSTGGHIINTVIQSGGTVTVNGGKVDKTMIMSSGTMTILSGAMAGSTESGNDKMWWSNGVIVNSDGTLNVSNGATAYIIYNPWSGTVNAQAGAKIYYQSFDEVTGVYYGGQAPGLVSLEDSMTRLEITSGYSAMVFREGEILEATLSEKSAYLHVYNGGKITNTTAVTSSIVNGFTLQTDNFYEQGIHISNAYVGSRMMGALYDGQTATNITVNLHGSLYIEGGAKLTSSFFDSGSVINGFTISESNENGSSIYISNAIVSSGTEAFVFNGQNVLMTSAQAGAIINGFVLEKDNFYKNGLTISNAYTGSGKSAYIYSGQTANANTVQAGGLLTVYNGGAAYATTLNGSMTVSMAGYASGITVNSGGMMTVYNGGKIADLQVNAGARVTLSSGAIINGFLLQRVNTYTNNIVINSAVVNSGVTTELYEGINARGITVNAHGKMLVYNNGWTSNTKILSAGELHLSSGGKAIAATISNGGIVHIFSGGAASQTNLMAGGYLGVGNGGKLYETTINPGGKLTVWQGGSAVSNTIMSNGNIFISNGAVAKENTILSGGGLHIYSGGVASATSIAQGAYLGVGHGGIASGNIVESCGEVIVWGGGLVDNNIIRTSGAIILSSGGAANSTTVEQDAGLHIYSGAIAYSTELTNGANLGVGKGGILYNMDAKADTKIILYDGAVLRGWNEFSGVVQVGGNYELQCGVDVDVNAAGSFIVFDLSELSGSSNTPIISNITPLQEATFLLTADSSVEDGLYILGGNATNFLGRSITFVGCLDPEKQLDVGGATIDYNGKKYTAGVTGNTLWVDIRTNYDISSSLNSWQEDVPAAVGEADLAAPGMELFQDDSPAMGCCGILEEVKSIVEEKSSTLLAVM